MGYLGFHVPTSPAGVLTPNWLTGELSVGWNLQPHHYVAPDPIIYYKNNYYSILLVLVIFICNSLYRKKVNHSNVVR